MIIKGITFSNCWLASGSMSFFGSGYWYHNLYSLIFPSFEDLDEATFVAKTTTFNLRPGNMNLDENYQPKDFLPGCIKAFPFRGAMLNAVGLSGPGAESLFSTGNWQAISKPFFISFMATGASWFQRLTAAQSFSRLLQKRLPEFKAPIGLQINISCPNIGHDTTELSREAIEILKVFRPALNLPIDVKVNALIKTEVALAIQNSGLCDVLTVANTVPWAAGDNIEWKKFSHKGDSPLANLGGGGLSGQPIRDTVLAAVRRLRRAGVDMPIKAGGGIMQAKDVDRYVVSGANAVEIGTVIVLRPWRVRSIIQRADELLSR